MAKSFDAKIEVIFHYFRKFTYIVDSFSCITTMLGIISCKSFSKIHTKQANRGKTIIFFTLHIFILLKK